MMKVFLLYLFLNLVDTIPTNRNLNSIFISDYSVNLIPTLGCNKNYVIKIDNLSYLNISLCNCEGSMSLKLYKGKVLMEEGNYIKSLDLLKEYNNRTSFDRKLGKYVTTIIVKSYYQPLRNGIWKFYTDKGTVIKEYKSGIEIQ